MSPALAAHLAIVWIVIGMAVALTFAVNSMRYWRKTARELRAEMTLRSHGGRNENTPSQGPRHGTATARRSRHGR